MYKILWFMGYPDYTISPSGIVKKRGVKVKTFLDNTGFQCVELKSTDSKNNIRKKIHRVHRLVAMSFIPNKNPSSDIYVKHKDGNILNNWKDNLEWSWKQENATKNKKISLSYQKNKLQDEILKNNEENFEFILMNGDYYLGIPVPKKYYELIDNSNSETKNVVDEFYEEINTAKRMKEINLSNISKENILKLIEEGVL